MKIARSNWVAVMLAAVMLVGMAPMALAKSPRIVTSLTGSTTYSTVKGKAKFKGSPAAPPAPARHGHDDSRDDRSTKTELEVEIEKARRLAGSTVKVLIDGVEVGTAVVDSLGKAELGLESEHGDRVPSVHSGSLVEVKTQTDVLVASGAFR